MPKRTGRPPGYRPDGQEIKRLRLEVLQISAAELAARIGVHRESISAAERGRPISDVFAHRLAKALGVKVEAIASPPAAKAALDAKKAPPR